jgi:hypothetical protein
MEKCVLNIIKIFRILNLNLFIKTKEFNSVQYSASVANFMNDQTLKPEADWHPKIKDVVYHG